MANLIKFAFVGDTHGHIDNMPRFINQFHQFKAEHPDLLTVFTGDFIGTTIESVYSQGQVDLLLLKRIYDQNSVMTLGNHDFDFGEKQLYDLLCQLNNQIVVTNIRFLKEGSPLKKIIKSHHAIRYQESVLVFLGLLPHEMKTTSDQLETVDVFNYEETLVAIRNEMALFASETRPVGFVILSHLGIDLDKALAEEIDHALILGGHSHTLVPLYLSSSKETAVAHAGSNAQYIGVINTVLTKQGFSQFSEGFIQVKDDIPKDEMADKAIKALTHKIYQYKGIDLNEEILRINLQRQLSGLEWNELIDSHEGHARYNDTFITRIMADAMVEVVNTKTETKVDIGLFHGGGVRARLPKHIITYRDIHNVFPYPQYLVTLKMRGDEILKALEVGVSMTNWHQRSNLLQPSERLHYAYDSRKARGARIGQVLIDGEPLVLDKQYKVVTNSWVGAGREGFNIFAKYWQAKQVQLFPELQQLQVFISYLKKYAPLILETELSQGKELFGLRIKAMPSLDASEMIARDPRFARGKEAVLQLEENEDSIQNIIRQDKWIDENAQQPSDTNPINPKENFPTERE